MVVIQVSQVRLGEPPATPAVASVFLTELLADARGCFCPEMSVYDQEESTAGSFCNNVTIPSLPLRPLISERSRRIFPEGKHNDHLCRGSGGQWPVPAGHEHTPAFAPGLL